MRILDLFCGAGGCSMGYHQVLSHAEIVGVDIKPQRHYPFTFVQADALTFPLDGFDLIHASPPCQAHTSSRQSEDYESWLWLSQTINRLRAWDSGLWVVENVMGAQMREHFKMCGSALGLVDHDAKLYLQRHRKFWSNGHCAGAICQCQSWKAKGYRCGGVYGGTSARVKSDGDYYKGFRPSTVIAKGLMGIDWMTRRELTQAIPPAYTKLIVEQLIDGGYLQLPSLHSPHSE